MAHIDTETTTGRQDISSSPGLHGGTRYEEKESATKHEAMETAGEVKQEAQRLTEEAKQRSKALFEGQRRAAADEIGGMVNALRKTAHDLDTEHRASTANLVGRAADSLDRIAGTLRERDFRALIGQMEGYARQHPGVFFGGSVIAGLLLARFLKSSGEYPRATSMSRSRHTSSERRPSESDYVF
jgi:hypothetical protein